ncbi:SDR family NAD(P)-dependent oxidoreductase [Ktedonobacter racemifer]|uniref:Short-chain dehydrogenase/reductase SDR n=1 Tax=Ktedonobacter racemifer DSM 44963 TaxID=485913 RepID=D6U6W6_KTERA|nr:SDR family NAD(P)-dependent oxidoreductase [Ktedonobacter racemifer]EFH80727.1 short-chain dehydrogenase/reductase SDR [Ktedonobacter racemifer DSM 44963]
MTLKEFSGAVAVVTGGASGIGKATAHALYTRGSHIVIADINEQALEAAAQELRTSQEASDRQIVTFALDVTDEARVQALMQRAAQVNGHIDLVVTSAGIGRGGPVDEFSGAEMQRLMDINFMGTYHAVRAALPFMRQQGSGQYVLISSVAGKLPPPQLSGYVASKWAVRGFSSALRAELFGSGIDVTTVYPAWVDTPMLQQEAGFNMNIEILLTPDMVAAEIVKAVQEGQADLTLAPNQDIAFALQLMKDDERKAEQLMGMAFHQQQQQASQASSEAR